MIHLGLSSCEVDTDAVSTRVFVGATALAVTPATAATVFFLYTRFLGGSELLFIVGVVKNMYARLSIFVHDNLYV
jgi:hypothetical protein